jgi:hypothetical protein
MYEVKYIHYGIVFIADEEHRFRIYVIYYMIYYIFVQYIPTLLTYKTTFTIAVCTFYIVSCV